MDGATVFTLPIANVVVVRSDRYDFLLEPRVFSWQESDDITAVFIFLVKRLEIAFFTGGDQTKFGEVFNDITRGGVPAFSSRSAAFE